MTVRLISFTDKGERLADTLAAALEGDAMRCSRPLSLEEWTRQAWQEADALVFVGAAGIAVRAIAAHIQSKDRDPAVVAVDDTGCYAVPLLSGHLGGANDLARRIETLCGAQAVITTATDRNGVFAVDEWARHQGCVIQNPAKIKGISSRLLAGETIRIKSSWPVTGEPPRGVLLTEKNDYDVLLTVKTGGRDVLRAVPRILVLGVGCRSGVGKEKIEEAFAALRAKGSVYEEAFCMVCSIDRKQEEPGLLAFCEAHGLVLKVYTAEELKSARGNFTPSAFVEKVTGVDNVCERSAVFGSGGELFLKKDAGNGVTMAAAVMPFQPDWR